MYKIQCSWHEYQNLFWIVQFRGSTQLVPPSWLDLRIVNPIFHWAFFGRVGADNAIHFALGTLQILFSLIKILFFKKTFA